MNPKGFKRKVLSGQLQNTFKNKQITCVEYDDLKPEEEREIFQVGAFSNFDILVLTYCSTARATGRLPFASRYAICLVR